jgi:hypothetical protein
MDGVRAAVCSVGGRPPSICQPVYIRPPAAFLRGTPPRVASSGSYPTPSCSACPARAPPRCPSPCSSALWASANGRRLRCSRGCAHEDAGAKSALAFLSASISYRMPTAIPRKSICPATAPSTLRGSACHAYRLQALRERAHLGPPPCHKTSQSESVIPVVPSDQGLVQV